MRDYLSSADREDYILTASLMDNLDKMIERGEKGSLTKEEKKSLKTASTLIYKSLDSIINRLNDSSKRTLANALKESAVYLTNKYGLNQYLKKKTADENAAFEENEDFYNLVEAITYHNCNCCTKNGSECDFSKQFDKLYISDMGDNFGNCRFAYNMPEKK